MTDFTMFDFKVTDGVAVATFNRPDKMNTFTPVVMRELLQLFDVTDADDAIRAVVITGSGRAFCAGAELGVAGGDTFNYAKRAAGDEIIHNGIRRDGGGRVVLRIYRSLKPVIAAVNGAAVGVGATMQLPMDFRIASTAARFGFVFARRGITPEACSSWFLPRLVGPQQALEWVLSADIFDAAEGQRGGLIRSVHAPDDLLPAAYALARKFIDGRSPVAVALARQMMLRNAAQPHPLEAHRIDSLAMFYTSIGDGKEGVAAFLEKRDPAFTSKASQMPPFYPWAAD